MYFITDYEKLQGKIIGFVHMATFANPIVIGTTDGGIMVARIEGDDDNDTVIRVLGEMAAEQFITKQPGNGFMMRGLVDGGVIEPGDLEKFIHKRVEAVKKQREELIKMQEEYDRNEYLRLKEKFEGARDLNQ